MPTDEREEGVELLDEVAAFVRRFVVVSAEQAAVLAAWIVHTHIRSEAGGLLFELTPYLVVSSPEKRCGKTKLLRVLALLCAKPDHLVVPTAAVIFRLNEADHPTLLIDELDAIFGKGRSGESEEALRGLVDAGDVRGVKVGRCAGKGADVRVLRFDTFGPKAFALIGRLPATLEDRAIVIEMKRKTPAEKVDRLFLTKIGTEVAELRERIVEWAECNLGDILNAQPEPFEALRSDRLAEGVMPLLAVVDKAGGQWPAHLRASLLAVCDSSARDDSAGVTLLRDMRLVFEAGGVDRISSAELCNQLNAMEASPWSEWRGGKPLTPSSLARLLRPYGIAPRTVRTEDGTPKGYHRDQFLDSFSRYLSAQPPHPPHFNAGSPGNRDCEPQRGATETPHRADVAPCGGYVAGPGNESQPLFEGFVADVAALAVGREVSMSAQDRELIDSAERIFGGKAVIRSLSE
jgi:Protein of unknown function (DUF3631)